MTVVLEMSVHFVKCTIEILPASFLTSGPALTWSFQVWGLAESNKDRLWLRVYVYKLRREVREMEGLGEDL